MPAVKGWSCTCRQTYRYRNFATLEESALKILGGNVRRERVARSISQQKLALLTGLNARTICKIEAGKLNIRQETIQRLRQAIGCSLSRLVEGTGKGS
jgi:transcriptional regulator with XRE-family HTH domain